MRCGAGHSDTHTRGTSTLSHTERRCSVSSCFEIHTHTGREHNHAFIHNTPTHAFTPKRKHHTKHKTFTPRTHHTRFIQMLADV